MVIKIGHFVYSLPISDERTSSGHCPHDLRCLAKTRVNDGCLNDDSGAVSQGMT